MYAEKVQVSIEDGDILKIPGIDNLHISKIEVFTGTDEYNETDQIELTASRGKIIAKRNIENGEKKFKFRTRNEPAARIFLETEGNTQSYVFTVCHHKGCVYAYVEKAE